MDDAIAQLRDHFDRRFDHLDRGFSDHEKRLAVVEGVQASRVAQLEALIVQGEAFKQALLEGSERFRKFEERLNENTETTLAIKSDTAELVRVVRGGRWFARTLAWTANKLRDWTKWLLPFIAIFGTALAAFLAWLEVKGKL